jgi:hypothetical protein
MNIEARVDIIGSAMSEAFRGAGFLEDRGGYLDPEPYAQTIDEQFSAEPQLRKLLPLIWEVMQQRRGDWLNYSDLDNDLQYAKAALHPPRHFRVNWNGEWAPVLQAHVFDPSTIVFRQKRTVNPESPFLYLLIGKNKALLVDTGGPCGQYWTWTVGTLVGAMLKRYAGLHDCTVPQLFVIHTHEQPGQCAGDGALTVLHPDDGAKLDLGGRTVAVLQTPGHCETDICLYDSETKILLAGHTAHDHPVIVRFQALNPVLEILDAFEQIHERQL